VKTSQELVQERRNRVGTHGNMPGGVHLCMEILNEISHEGYVENAAIEVAEGVILVKDAP